MRPATTGETAKGRSMRVVRMFLPGNSNLAMAQAAATPKVRLSGTAMAAMSKVSRMAGRVSGVREGIAGRRRSPFEGVGEDADEGHEEQQEEVAEGHGDEQPLDPAGLGGGLPLGGHGVPAGLPASAAGVVAVTLMALMRAGPRLPPAHFCRRLMPRSRAKERTSIMAGHRGGAGVIVLLQLADDDEGDDFGLHGHVAGDEDDRTVFAQGAGEGQGHAR